MNFKLSHTYKSQVWEKECERKDDYKVREIGVVVTNWSFGYNQPPIFEHCTKLRKIFDFLRTQHNWDINLSMENIFVSNVCIRTQRSSLFKMDETAKSDFVCGFIWRNESGFRCAHANLLVFHENGTSNRLIEVSPQWIIKAFCKRIKDLACMVSREHNLRQQQQQQHS